MKKDLKNCTAAFSKCRRYEDAGGPVIATCTQDINKLKEKAKTLTKNKNSLINVKTKINKVISASSRAASNTCNDFIALLKLGKGY